MKPTRVKDKLCYGCNHYVVEVSLGFNKVGSQEPPFFFWREQGAIYSMQSNRDNQKTYILQYVGSCKFFPALVNSPAV